MLWRQATTAFLCAFKNKLVVEVEVLQPFIKVQPIVSYKHGLVRITFPDQPNPLLETENSTSRQRPQQASNAETPPKPCDGTLKRCVLPEYPSGKGSGR